MSTDIDKEKTTLLKLQSGAESTRLKCKLWSGWSVLQATAKDQLSAKLTDKYNINKKKFKSTNQLKIGSVKYPTCYHISLWYREAKQKRIK